MRQDGYIGIRLVYATAHATENLLKLLELGQILVFCKYFSMFFFPFYHLTLFDLLQMIEDCQMFLVFTRKTEVKAIAKVLQWGTDLYHPHLPRKLKVIVGPRCSGRT